MLRILSSQLSALKILNNENKTFKLGLKTGMLLFQTYFWGKTICISDSADLRSDCMFRAV